MTGHAVSGWGGEEFRGHRSQEESLHGGPCKLRQTKVSQEFYPQKMGEINNCHDLMYFRVLNH